MRAPILGAALAHHPGRLARFVRVSTRITHVDPRSEQAALAIAFAAAHAVHSDPHQATTGDVLAAVRRAITDGEFARKLDVVGDCLARGDSPAAFAAAMGLQNGVSGFAPDSACAALFCWLRHPGSFPEAVEAVIRLGGDTDSTAAIVGGLAGAASGTSAIPRAWLSGLAEWPRTPAWLVRVGARVAAAIDDGRPVRSVPLFWPAVPLRNAIFLLVAIAHLFRRVLPPY
jgi:ADP-ribosylglycohydrolase